MEDSSSPALAGVIEYVRSQRGIDLSAYKETSLRRRLARRLEAVGAGSYEDYLDRLQASPNEFEPLLEALFINVTQFFRDAEAWDVLREQTLPRILERKTESDAIRVWCAGAASGEEAYSLAILLCEALGVQAFRERVKIYATDIDENELVRARQGTYSHAELERVPEPLRATYFGEGEAGCTFRSDLRHCIIFGRHNLLDDAPISRLDLLVCRNTLMYFNRAAQGKILARFHFGLRPGGFLFLGRAELLLTRRSLFVPVDPHARIFAKVAPETTRERASVLSEAAVGNPGNPVAGLRVRDLAFDHSPVPQMVVDTRGLLTAANHAALKQLRLMREDVGQPFRDLDLSFRPVELRAPIEQAMLTGEPVTLRGIKRPRRDGGLEFFDIRIAAVPGSEAPIGATISFVDVTDGHDLHSQLEQANGALETAYEELQSTNEELETTNEELQSTIEELETTNEEFQSTNEELETMNEELQSGNEEIRGMNQELRDRNETITRLNAYMRSILNSVQPAIVVLDDDLHIDLWNDQATELWGLRGDEVSGEPFLNLEIGLPVARLKDDLHRCLRTGLPTEPVGLSAHNRRGKAMTCRVTCAPLHGPQKEVSGVIMMMEEWQAASVDGAPA
jgi:two-component system CheB/CheR fusion protein